jgi:hypothetical protein
MRLHNVKLVLLAGAMLPSLALADTLHGSFNMTPLGSAGAYSGTAFTFDPNTLATAINPSGNLSLAGGSLISYHAPILVPGDGTLTSDPITDLFSVGNYQFNLASVQAVDSNGILTLYGQGSLVDTSNALSPSVASFTLNTSGPPINLGQAVAGINYSASFAATGVSPVPLPAAVWLMVTGLGGLGVLTRRRKVA